MFLSQLVFYSVPNKWGDQDLEDVLANIRARNTLDHVTGSLLYNGSFIVQVLEGERKILTEKFSKIFQDPRHTDVTLMNFSYIDERTFTGFSCGYIGADRTDEPLILRFFPDGAFDPRIIRSPKALVKVMALLTKP